MDFFERQDKARKQTKLLVFYFAIAVAALIVAVYFASLAIFTGAQAHYHRYGEQPEFALWNPQLFLGVAAGVLAVVFIGSTYKTMALAQGGSVVSEMMGGRLIKPNTNDPDERKLLNIVEEMAIASGVPVPQVYVMDGEDGINAFAAGHKPGDATVTVTRGCMKILSRDELQGVIGHEFSHILNGDMRMNLRLMGIIFGILCLAIIGRVLLQTARGSGGRGRGQNPLPLLGLTLLIIGYIGVFFGRLIQAAVSRQREFLADASSVQFTRNPGGITGALKKIGCLGETGSRLGHAHAEELSHMFFGNGVSEPFIGLLETHPPLAERIRVFDPNFDGQFPVVRYDGRDQMPEGISKPKRAQMPNLFGTVMGGAIFAAGDAEEPPVIRSHSVLPNVGNPTPLHLKYAEQLRDSLPDSVKAAAREPLDSVALIYAMLLSNDETERASQLAGLASRADAAMAQKTDALFPDVSQAAAHAHLPMVNLTLGTLRHLTAEQYNQFSQTLEWLIGSDGKIELFEFVLQKIILHHLAPQFGQTSRAVVQYYSIKPLVPDCAVLLSALANISSSNASEIQKAFEVGAPYLRAPEDGELALLPREQCGVDQIDAALNRMAQAAPLIKKNLLEACIHAVGADGMILEAEAELLRAIADTLDCPMPPFVPAE
jgi:Zn-dependent protease with chaperone function